jgi:hypothetical protein
MSASLFVRRERFPHKVIDNAMGKWPVLEEIQQNAKAKAA